MNLTIADLSKKTKLSVPTLRVYVSRYKLGKKVGNNRVFTQADVDKLLKSSKGSKGKAKGGQKPKSVKTAKTAKAAKAVKKPAKARVSKRTAPAKVAPVAAAEKPMPKSEKRSFWSTLFGTRKPKQKVDLMQAKSTK